jgi:hypothetical protein
MKDNNGQTYGDRLNSFAFSLREVYRRGFMDGAKEMLLNPQSFEIEQIHKPRKRSTTTE